MSNRFGYRLWRLVMVLALWFTMAGCASRRGDSITGLSLIELDEAWAAAAAAGDVEAVMGYWAENAVMYAPDLPPLHGREAIGELIRNRRSRPGYKISWTPCCAGIEKDGSMAYTLGEGKVTLVDDSGVPREFGGRYVAIWREEADRWRCAVKCWTPAPLDSIASP
jgi:ketosteroid isomerase-like protein